MSAIDLACNIDSVESSDWKSAVEPIRHKKMSVTVRGDDGLAVP